MTSTIHVTMHRDHKEWEKEIGWWRDEIAMWQKELLEVDNDFAALKEAFERRAEAYRQHAAAIRMLEQESDIHEHALASFEKGADGNELLGFAKQHDSELTLHSERRQTHERIKRHHHALLAQWKPFVRLFVSGLARD